jgi:hypothetical protein
MAPRKSRMSMVMCSRGRLIVWLDALQRDMQDPCNTPKIENYTVISNSCYFIGDGWAEEDCGKRVIELCPADSNEGGKDGKAGRV